MKHIYCGYNLPLGSLVRHRDVLSLAFFFSFNGKIKQTFSLNYKTVLMFLRTQGNDLS